MPAVRLLTPALPATPMLGEHRKATMASETLQITFPYLDKEGDIADLARMWVEQARPGDHKPLTRPGSPKLAKVSLTALFADPADTQRSMEPILGILRAMAGSARPVVVTFGDLMGDTHWTASGRWVIQSLSIHPQARAHEGNQITRAEASLDLLEANIPGWVPLPSTERYATEIPGAGRGVPRSELVADGDRLWTIARRVYGDPTRWIALGDANGIVDPRHQLTAGLVLQVP